MKNSNRSRRGWNPVNKHRRRSGPAQTPQGQVALAPDAITVGDRHLIAGGQWIATLAIAGYPRDVWAGWLTPVLNYPGHLDISVFIDPIDPMTAADRMRRQLARLESSRRATAEKGRLYDAITEAATDDAYQLADALARGEGRLFRIGLYLTVYADTEKALADEVDAVRALCASILLDAKPVTYRALQGWTSCLPLGVDRIAMTRTFDTDAASSLFPFDSPDLPALDPASAAANPGVLYGYTANAQSLVIVDRFAAQAHNHNAVVFGRSGAGKSYFVKLELLRALHRGIEELIIDPENEYESLSDAVGGTYIHLGGGYRINPFDVPHYRHADGTISPGSGGLREQTLFLHTFIDTLTGSGDSTGSDATERGILDETITGTYAAAGYTDDPATWVQPAPLLADLRAQLAAHPHPAAETLAARLHPYTDGAWREMFDGPTTATPAGQMVVWSLRDVPEAMKPIATLLVLHAIWGRVDNPDIRWPRLVVVDEAWRLLRSEVGVSFLSSMARAARKRHAGLTIISQEVADVLGTDLGRAVISNAATQILLRQASQAIDQVAQAFSLSEGEKQFLLTASKGQALMLTGEHKVIFQSTASETEHALCTTAPAETSEAAADSGFSDDYAPYAALAVTTPEGKTVEY